MPDPVGEIDLPGLVQYCLDEELTRQGEVLAELGVEVDDLLEEISTLLAGGKRLRASFLYWGYRAAGGEHSPALVRAAAAMEMFQAAALIHDDVMDESDTRRGRPAVHRALQQRHERRHWEGSSARFGSAGAILAGNLCLSWSDEMYADSGLPAHEVAAGRPIFTTMRSQLMAGQYLDVVESVRPWSELDTDQRLRRAHRVIRYKSAKYSIEHPVLIGASAAGADAASLACLSDYGLALGHAFQLRDDVLGVFGDPGQTGKPAGDDLREGKRTVLLAHALERSTPTGRRRLVDLVGRADLSRDGVDEVRSIMDSGGAVEAVEQEIDDLVSQAVRALESMPAASGDSREMLRRLIGHATARRR